MITLDTYGHLFEGLDEAAADRLDEAFLRTPADSRPGNRLRALPLNDRSPRKRGGFSWSG